MPKAPGSLVRAFALSDTELRFAFPEGERLDTGCLSQVQLKLTHDSITPPPGASELLRAICRRLDEVLKDVEGICLQEHHYLDVRLGCPEAIDKALCRITEACQPFRLRMRYDRNALRAILG